MIQVPRIHLPGKGVHLITGEKLNQLCAALQARTQLDADDASPQGTTGQDLTGIGPKIPRFRARFDPRRSYVLSPGFLDRLCAAIRARSPLAAAAIDATGWDLGGSSITPPRPRPSSTRSGILSQVDALQAITPRDTAQTDPLGYRFPPPPRPPRQARIVLELWPQWAEGWLCAGIVNAGKIYSQEEIVAIYDEGTITTTITQPDIGPHLWNAAIQATGTPKFACQSTQSTDDTVPGKYYGNQTGGSTTYSGEVDPTTALDLAQSNVQPDPSQPSSDIGDWTWGEYDPPPSFGSTPVASTSLINAFFSDFIVSKPKYRWKNEGQLHITINWQEGSTNRTILLAPGDQTDWYVSGMPATYGVSNNITNLQLLYPPTS